MQQNYTATIVGYEYVHSTQGGLVQGIKNNKRPKNALYGGNGSFIVKGESPKIIIKIKLWDKSLIGRNIYYTVKSNTMRDRITEKYADKIAGKLLGQTISIPNDADDKLEYCNCAFDLLVIDIINKLN